LGWFPLRRLLPIPLRTGTPRFLRPAAELGGIVLGQYLARDGVENSGISENDGRCVRHGGHIGGSGSIGRPSHFTCSLLRSPFTVSKKMNELSHCSMALSPIFTAM